MKKIIFCVLTFLLSIYMVNAIDSCELDRSCCNQSRTYYNTTCVRTDYNNSIRQPINVIDLFSDNESFDGGTYSTISVSNTAHGVPYIHFRGSPMWLQRDDVVSYAWGLGRVRYLGYNLFPYGAMRLLSGGSVGTSGDYHWRPDRIIFKDQKYGPRAKIEGMLVPVDENSFILKFMYECTDADDCDTTPEMPYILTSSNSQLDKLNITYRSDYTGNNDDCFSIHMEESGITDVGTINQTFFLCINDTFDNYLINNTPGGKSYIYFNLSNGEHHDWIAVFTTNNDTINSYLTNYQSWIDNATENITSFFRMFKYPSGNSDGYQKKRYYYGVYILWFNFVKTHNNNDLFKGREFLRPGAGYVGQWIWDSGFGCWGFALACKNDNTTCFDIAKNLYKVWNESVNSSTGKIPRQINPDDASYDYSVTQSNGLWSLCLDQIYRKDNDNVTLCNYYDSLKKFHDYYNNTLDEDSDGMIDPQSASDEGWDGTSRYDAGAIDSVSATVWHILDSWSLRNIAQVCNSSETSRFSNDYYTFKNSLLTNMWNGTFIYDLILGTNLPVIDESEEVRSGAVYMTWFVNITNSTIDSALQTELYRNDTGLGINTSTGTGLLPTVARDRPDFDADGSGKTWNGANWMNINLMAWIGAKNRGLTTLAEYIKNKTMEQLEISPLGFESYDSDDGGKASGGFGGETYVWSDVAYMLMSLNTNFNWTNITKDTWNFVNLHPRLYSNNYSQLCNNAKTTLKTEYDMVKDYVVDSFGGYSFTSRAITWTTPWKGAATAFIGMCENNETLMNKSKTVLDGFCNNTDWNGSWCQTQSNSACQESGQTASYIAEILDFISGEDYLNFSQSQMNTYYSCFLNNSYLDIWNKAVGEYGVSDSFTYVDNFTKVTNGNIQIYGGHLTSVLVMWNDTRFSNIEKYYNVTKSVSVDTWIKGMRNYGDFLEGLNYGEYSIKEGGAWIALKNVEGTDVFAVYNSTFNSIVDAMTYMILDNDTSALDYGFARNDTIRWLATGDSYMYPMWRVWTPRILALGLNSSQAKWIVDQVNWSRELSRTNTIHKSNSHRNLIFYPYGLSSQSPSQLSLSKATYFNNTGRKIYRTGWEGNFTVFSAVCGDMYGWHTHTTCGFEVFAFGEYLLVDGGQQPSWNTTHDKYYYGEYGRNTLIINDKAEDYYLGGSHYWHCDNNENGVCITRGVSTNFSDNSSHYSPYVAELIRDFNNASLYSNTKYNMTKLYVKPSGITRDYVFFDNFTVFLDWVSSSSLINYSYYYNHFSPYNKTTSNTLRLKEGNAFLDITIFDWNITFTNKSSRQLISWSSGDSWQYSSTTKIYTTKMAIDTDQTNVQIITVMHPHTGSPQFTFTLVDNSTSYGIKAQSGQLLYHILWNKNNWSQQPTVTSSTSETPPVVKSMIPANNTQIYGSTVNFTIIANDTQGLKNISIYTNKTGTWSITDTWFNPQIEEDNENITLYAKFDGNYYLYNGTNATSSNGVVFTDGKFNQGAEFELYNDYVSYSGSVINESQGTIELWFKPIMSWTPATPRNFTFFSLNNRTRLFWESKKDRYVFLYNGTRLYADASAPTDTQFWYIAVSWGNNGTHIVLGDIEIAANTTNNESMGTVYNNIIIGKQANVLNTGISAILDDFSVWNVQKTTTQIVNDYSRSDIEKNWTVKTYNWKNGTYLYGARACDTNDICSWFENNYTITVIDSSYTEPETEPEEEIGESGGGGGRPREPEEEINETPSEINETTQPEEEENPLQEILDNTIQKMDETIQKITEKDFWKGNKTIKKIFYITLLILIISTTIYGGIKLFNAIDKK